MHANKQPIRPHFPIKDIAIQLIDLDLRNSRFPRDAISQSDAFELMLNTVGDECIDLLRDLTRIGRLNSSDLPIVIFRDGRYIMMEGNRRLTCLLLWANPSILHDYAVLEKKYFSRVEKIINDSIYLPPTKLRVAIAQTESDADTWIERKHTGGSGGAGTVEWGAAMKDRRNARNDPTKASRAMAFVELISSTYADEEDILSSLEKVRDKRYSFIQRFVDRSVVRDMIGLDFSSGKMTFRYGAEASMPIIRKILSDFSKPKADSGKSWARELDTVSDFRIYLEKYLNLLPSTMNYENISHGSTPIALQDSSNDISNAHSNAKVNEVDEMKKSATLGKSGKFDRENLVDLRPPRPNRGRENIFRGLKMDNFTYRIQEIVRQTSFLNISRHNEMASVMLRVILDLTAYQFLRSHGTNQIPRDLDKRIKMAIKIIDPNASDALGSAENTSPLRKAFHATDSDSIKLVQYAVHDIYSGKTPNEVLVLADRYTPVLEAMNDHMGSNPVI